MSATIRTLAELPTVQARLRGDQAAVRIEDRTLTYAELDRRAAQVAGLLAEAGVRPGDRIGWLGRSSEAFFEILFAAARLRACLAPINSRLAGPEIAFILQDSGADLFFVTREFFDTGEQVAAQVDRPIRLIGVGGARPGFESYEALREAAEPRVLADVEPADDVLQLYTSGTTGLPKGVRLNNANFSAFLQLRTQVEGFDYGPDDTVLIVMPLFHVAGTNISFSGLAAGGRIILLPEFRPAEVLRLIEEEKVAHVFLVPAMINMLLQAPEIETADLSSLKTVAYGWRQAEAKPSRVGGSDDMREPGRHIGCGQGLRQGELVSGQGGSPGDGIEPACEHYQAQDRQVAQEDDEGRHHGVAPVRARSRSG